MNKIIHETGQNNYSNSPYLSDCCSAEIESDCTDEGTCSCVCSKCKEYCNIKVKERIMDSWIMPMLRIAFVFAGLIFLVSVVCYFISCWQMSEAVKMEAKIHLIEPTETGCIYFTTSTHDQNYTLISGATITGYTSEIGQTDDRPLEMANGHEVFDGAMACPSKYEFGTKIEYDGKIYVCADRMNKRYRDKNYFDIWFLDKQDALSFGVKYNQTIKIIL
jgi:hypothetical protein